MTHWAILVGVIYYGPHRIEDNKLKGCVADVEDMEEFLKLRMAPDKIFKLTSSHPMEGTGQPPEGPRERASAGNFRYYLRHVINSGEEGDNVYIHYSGHGGKALEDIRLNFYASTKGQSQLTGEIVANHVKEMVDKKMHVTVAFDCCFSAATKRGSAHGLRFSNYIEPVEGSDGILENVESAYSEFRNSRVIPQWITNPQSYTIFCACTPSQKANEVSDTDLGSCETSDPEHLPVARRPSERGALSYLLLKALKQFRETGIAVTDGSLFEHLRARFHARIPDQTPVFYGSKRTSFFTNNSSLPSDKITAISKKDGKIILRKGSAHGVQLGDKYALFPLGDSAKASDRLMRPRRIRDAESDSSSSLPAENFVNFEVTKLEGLTSVLQADDNGGSIAAIEDGWMAYPRTQMDLRSNFVQLLTEDRSDIEWQKASADLPHLRIICEDGDKRSFTYNVQVHMEKEYQICYSSLQPVQFVPSVPLDRDFAKYRVVELLDHMTTYKYIEGIENRLSTQSLSKSFNARMYMSDDEKSRSTENCVLEVTVGQEFTFEIINLSEDVLHIYLYALRPDWSIVDQLTEFRSTERVELGPVCNTPYAQGSNHRDCRFKTTFKATLSQNFPSDHVTSEDEVFKLFVTRRADSFAGLRMDALSSSPRRGTLNTLKDFLAARRDRRRGGSDSDHEEEWFTKNFIVKTKAVST